jgi:hypothetical protein
MTWPLKERLPYGHRGPCQFLLVILILLIILGAIRLCPKDHEQEHESTIAMVGGLWNNETLS